MSLLLTLALSVAAVAAAHLEDRSNVESLVLNVTATHDLAPRATQTGISPIQCTLQLSTVQCCQTIEPVSLLFFCISFVSADDIPRLSSPPFYQYWSPFLLQLTSHYHRLVLLLLWTVRPMFVSYNKSSHMRERIRLILYSALGS